jgi:tungstate transport system ATP-binding protein
MGHFLKVQLDCGFFLATHITRRSREQLGLVEGGAVVASFKATAVHLIPHAQQAVEEKPV